jgi:hypothetical protein
MAEAPKSSGPGPLEDAIFILGFIVVLVVLWVYTGGPSRNTLKGIFIHPPAPVGQGGAYGPTVATTTIKTGAHY